MPGLQHGRAGRRPGWRGGGGGPELWGDQLGEQGEVGCEETPPHTPGSAFSQTQRTSQITGAQPWKESCDAGGHPHRWPPHAPQGLEVGGPGRVQSRAGHGLPGTTQVMGSETQPQALTGAGRGWTEVDRQGGRGVTGGRGGGFRE